MEPPATVASLRGSLERRRGYRYVEEMFARHHAKGAPLPSGTWEETTTIP